MAVPTSLRSRLQTGVAWNLLGSFFNQGSTFAVNIIVANLLGRQVFGEYAMIQSTIVTLSNVAQLAVGYTTTKYVAEFRSADKAKTGRILGLCTVVSAATACVAALALSVGARWLAAETLQAPQLTSGLMIAAGVVLFTVMNGYQMGALAGLESYPALGVAGILSGSLYLGICALTAWAGGLNGVLAGLVASAVIQWGVLSWFLRRESARQMIAIDYRGVVQERAILLKFALPAAIGGSSTMSALWLANTFLVRQPGGYEQMALYSAANNFRVIVLFLPNIVNNVGLSLLNNQKGLEDEGRYQKVFWVNLALTAGVAICGAAGVALLGPVVLGMFGRSFSEGYPVLLVLMLSTFPEALWYVLANSLASHDKFWLLLYTGILPRDACIALLAYLLSPSFGAMGVASGYAISWVASFILVMVLVWQTGLRAVAHGTHLQGVNNAV